MTGLRIHGTTPWLVEEGNMDHITILLLGSIPNRAMVQSFGKGLKKVRRCIEARVRVREVLHGKWSWYLKSSLILEGVSK